MTTTITEAIRQAFLDLWADVVGIIPELVAAIVVFVIGLIIAAILGRLTRKLVQFLKVDSLAERANLHEILSSVGLSFKFSDVLGIIVKWFFIIVFLNAAVEILGWNQITSFLNDVLRYIPNVVVAVAIMAIGLIVASFVQTAVVRALKSAKAPVRSPETLGAISRWAIIAFAVMAALSQLGIAEDLIMVLFAAVLFTLALSFGLAGKTKAEHFLNRVLQ